MLRIDLKSLAQSEENKKRGWIPIYASDAFGGEPEMWALHGDPIESYYCANCGHEAYLYSDDQLALTRYCPDCGCDNGDVESERMTLPESCKECEFWKVNVGVGECGISGSKKVLDGTEEDERMEDCMLMPEEESAILNLSTLRTKLSDYDWYGTAIDDSIDLAIKYLRRAR